MTKISVIMPSLNVQKYIEQAVKSVMSQTLQEIEIICVDAGSTDGTVTILNALASVDDRIKIIHSDKKSYGYQMNLGISHAVGEYIGIVETDDYVLHDMYEELYRTAKTNDLDFVKSDFYKFWWSEKYSQRVNVSPSSEYYGKVLTEKDRKIFFTFQSLNWTGIYKREYLLQNDIWHSDTPGASYQDIGFWLLNMSFARRAMWINKAFYMYRQDNPGSSMKDRGKMLCSLNEYERVLSILKKSGLKVAYLECLLLKQTDYIVTFKRISDEIKREYLSEITDAYRIERELITYDKLTNTQEYCIDWLDRAINNPDEVCNSIIAKNQYVLKELRNADRIYVYGAGQIATDIFAKLYNLDFWGKVNKVVVSEQSETEVFFQKCICKWKEEQESITQNDLLILALGKKNREEVLSNINVNCSVLNPNDFQDLILTI